MCIASILENCIKQTPEIFHNYIQPLIPVVFDGIRTIDDPVLKEFSFEFFYSLATFLKGDFKIYLDDIMTLIFLTIENIQQVELVKQTPQVVPGFQDDSDDEDEPAGYIDENIMEELAAAICCLGEMAMACPVEFYPYYEKVVNALQNFASYHYYNVRIQTLECLRNLAKALVKISNNGELPKFKKGKHKKIALS